MRETRELADELERKKKFLRKKEERRRSRRERERIGNSFFNREEREVNKKFFFLDVSYSAHLKIDVHCSGEAKNFAYCSTTVSFFYVQWC